MATRRGSISEISKLECGVEEKENFNSLYQNSERLNLSISNIDSIKEYIDRASNDIE